MQSGQPVVSGPTLVPSSLGQAPSMGQVLPPGPVMPTPSQQAVAFELPRRLTDGLPDPCTIERWKLAHKRSLDSQLEQGTIAVVEQTKVKKEMLTQAFESQKKQYNLQVEQRLRMQEMVCDQQLHKQVMGLKQAAFEEKSKLERQASALKMEYEHRKLQEDISVKQYQLQRHQYDVQMKVQSDAVQRMCGPADVVDASGKCQVPPPCSFVPSNFGVPPTNYDVLPKAW